MRLRPQKRIAVAEPTRVLVRRPRFRRAVVTGCGAAIALVVGSSVVPRHAHTLGGRALLDLPALVFLILVVLCATWPAGAEVGPLVPPCACWSRVSATPSHSWARFPCCPFRSGTCCSGAPSRVSSSVSRPSRAWAMSSRDSCLLARPFAVGNRVRVRSGALGGEFYGTVASMSLTYVSVLTDDGMLKVPNSSVLAAAVGPWDRATPLRPESNRTELPVVTGAGPRSGAHSRSN